MKYFSPDVYHLCLLYDNIYPFDLFFKKKSCGGNPMVFLCFVCHVNSSILLPFLLQLIIPWSLKRKGPATGLSVQESSVCTLSLFSSASSSAVAVLARPGAPTVRNVPFQEQVRGSQKKHILALTCTVHYI